MPKSRQSAAALKAPQPAPLAKAQPWEVDEAPAKSHSGTATPENDLTAEDFEESVPADLAAGSEGAPAKEEPRPKDREIEESGGDSMLARYFREMATHSVMGQEEELATAIEVEKAEIAQWVALFSHLPA